VREPEPETIDRARNGDLRAFESLVRDYQGDVWRFAYHLTRNRSMADDVTQEAFLHAYRAMGSYRGEAKFTSWLLRIVRNCAVDAYRRVRRERATAPGDDQEDPAARHVADQSSAADERIRITAAVRALPIDLREPFVIIEILGFNYREASTILGVKVGTIKSRMHRARATLMAALTEREAAGEM
jgi:RNA polymerase sigma-70 factor (ECF subfamily)